MALAQADRLSFSLNIISAPAQIAAIQTAQSTSQSAITSAQSLDTGNMNLLVSPTALINGYQGEIAFLDGNVRTTIVEQDIQDSANKKLQNHFYPNDTTVTVPSLSALHNVWTQFAPFAMGYAIGLDYTEAYPSTITSEPTAIAAITALITAAGANQDIQNTSGQTCSTPDGTCSLPQYTTESTCTTGGGTWTPGVETIASDAAIVTLKTNMVAAVTALQTLLASELAAIPTDSNSARQTQNTAAAANIAVIQAALTAWQANPDFNPVPGSVTTCSEFYAYNPALLAPTKLYSGQLSILTAALAARQTFITTRLGQLNTNLGSITQSTTDGSITASSGLYGQRYGILNLRLNLLTGSLTTLKGLQATTGAQSALISSVTANKNTYYSLIPTSAFQAPGNSTAMVSLTDVSFITVGDVIYVAADNQPELILGVKAINGNSVTLTGPITPQYGPTTNGRLYKDNS